MTERAGERAEAPDRLDELYARHVPGAIGLAYLLTGDRHQAEDLAQEAFARLAGRFRHLRAPEGFAAYLRRTVVNLHLSRLRRVRVERRYVQREGARIARPEEAADVALREDLWAALGGLPAPQRAAVVLRYYEDLSERDAAELLGCSVAALKSRVQRALETLRATVRSEDT